MSSRLLPPPPLMAPTPSKVRPVAEPLMVIVVAAAAGVASRADRPAAITARTVNWARRRRDTGMVARSYGSHHGANAAHWPDRGREAEGRAPPRLGCR